MNVVEQCFPVALFIALDNLRGKLKLNFKFIFLFVISDPFQENKKSAKRREIDNKHLKQVLSGVIEHVRIGHVLPPHSELLESVFRRALAERGMPLDIGEGSFYPNLPWMRRREERDFVRPRLFLPYFEEAKVSVWRTCFMHTVNDLINASLRADFSYFLCFAFSAWSRDIGDVCTQANKHPLCAL